jgi:P-type Ca2+ transporter type 2C
VALALLTQAFGTPMLLLPIHLVWLELIIHPVSAVVFQAEPPPRDLMRVPPRSPTSPLLPRPAMVRSVAVGVALTVAVFSLYRGHLAEGEVAARSLAWATLLLGYQVLVLVEWAALRGKSGPRLPRMRTVWLVWSLCGVSLPLALSVPAVARLLHVAPLSFARWGLALGVALLVTLWRPVLDRLRPAL